MERKTETLNPIIFYDDSESYFQKLFLMKSDLEKLIKPHHLIKLYCIFKKTYYIIFLFLSNIVVVVVVIMSSLQKYEYFFPRKVYRCACLFQVIEESFDTGDHSLVEILSNIKNFKFIAHYYEPLAKFFCVTCGDVRIVFLYVKNIWLLFYLQKENLFVHNLKTQKLRLFSLMVKKRFIVKIV